jgi:hypothetical protein
MTDINRAPHYAEQKKAVAVVICFENDEDLATFQRVEWAEPGWLCARVVEHLDGVGAAPPTLVYTAGVKIDRHAPTIYDPTITPFHRPERPSERAMRLSRERGSQRSVDTNEIL